MRDRNFYINSIKMDLFRVVTSTGDVSKPPAIESAREFLDHAISDFDKFENTDHDQVIKNNLIELRNDISKLNNPPQRLHWAEDILTNRCRIF